MNVPTRSPGQHRGGEAVASRAAFAAMVAYVRAGAPSRSR